MTTTRNRIGVLGWVFGGAFCVVVVHLWFVMVAEHEVWARRSHENRWSFKSVPSQRGDILDRRGRVLARDEPTTQLAVHYVRFRLRHPVGAAVHGATAWARQQPARDGTTYDYFDGALGPEAAARDLLAMPVRLLQPGVLPKNVASELATAVTTVLAGCSGRSRSKVFAALRAAAHGNSGVCVGEVLGTPLPELLDAFAARWRGLQQLDARLLAERQQRTGAVANDDDEPGLVQTLELLRRASLAGTRVTWVDNGKPEEGSLLESVRRVFADRVPFDIAADLRVAGERFVGIDVLPSVTRRVEVPEQSTLRVLLGSVLPIDHTLPGIATAKEKDERRSAIDTIVARELPDGWLDDLEPTDDETADDARELLRAEAKERFTRELLVRERRGTTGIERAFDAELMGTLGMRLVEQDAQRREQQLWSHLRVEPGEDVQITIDFDLQRAAEAVATSAWQRHLHGDERDRAKVEAAIAVIDAHSGDVLAYAGAPIVSPAARDVPGVVWIGNGALGSVVKPFVLVEQLQCEAVGRPHRPIASLDACHGSMLYNHRTLRCDGSHGLRGCDPIEALAQSCNVFFYQCGIGLQDDGIARALQRFGLTKAERGDAFAACWQPSVSGIPVAEPTRATWGVELPQRAIGYGVQASPLHVARAYAALATGWLPTLGLRPAPRARVPLDDVVGELVTVRKGLRACVETGTARHLALLDELGVCGKTGTAEVREISGENNAWFAGWLPDRGEGNVQLCCCAVVYWVQDKTHGAEAAGSMVADLLTAVRDDPELAARYLLPGGGR